MLIPQFVLVGSLMPLCWLLMQAVHELGHVLGAWLTGGTVSRVVLHPFTISHTELSSNPNPLLVAWAGPVLGVLLPLAAFGIAATVKMPAAYLLRFFAGFCLVANGAYIGVGSFDGIGDAGDLLRHGCRAGWLWSFGVVSIPLGLFIWHGQSRDFGIGKDGGEVNREVAFACLALLVVVIVLEMLLGASPQMLM